MNLQATIPQPNAPFLDQSGNISRPWLYFMLQILNRTGAQTGISSNDLLTDITSLDVEMAMSDQVLGPTQPLISVMDIASDTPLQPSLVPASVFDIMSKTEDQQPTANATMLALALGSAT